MEVAIIALPLAGALAALLLRSDARRPLILVAAALSHLIGSIALVASDGTASSGGWLGLDAPGQLVLMLISVLGLVTAVYAVGYLDDPRRPDNRPFVVGLLAMLASLTLVACAQHFGLVWVGITGATLSAAPLIYFDRGPGALAATWRYLLIVAIGLALALLGTFFVGYAVVGAGQAPSLLYDELVRIAPSLPHPWLESSFLLLLVGYGSAMGLAPMHTWKPGAYGEAPGPTGALVAGGLTSCAFLAVMRALHVCDAAGADELPRDALIAIGLLSMGLAAVLLLYQRDFKRMLAYAVVEHMGILAVGLGLGGAALFGTLLHLVASGLAAALLVLSAANIHRAYGTSSSERIIGAMRRLPLSGSVFLLAFFAVTGAPPFGPFVSQLWIVGSAFAGGSALIAILFLVFVLIAFIGMGATVLPLCQGRFLASSAARPRERGLTVVPIVGLLVLIVVLGLALPLPLEELIDRGVAALHTGAP